MFGNLSSCERKGTFINILKLFMHEFKFVSLRVVFSFGILVLITSILEATNPKPPPPPVLLIFLLSWIGEKQPLQFWEFYCFFFPWNEGFEVRRSLPNFPISFPNVVSVRVSSSAVFFLFHNWRELHAMERSSSWNFGFLFHAMLRSRAFGPLFCRFFCFVNGDGEVKALFFFWSFGFWYCNGENGAVEALTWVDAMVFFGSSFVWCVHPRLRMIAK